MIAVLNVGCSSSKEGRLEIVRIGYQKAGTLNLLRLRGTLAAELLKQGVSVEWVGFPAGPQLLEALNAGAIDFGHTGDAPPILAQAAGVPFVYVAQEPSRPHSEAIIVPSTSTLHSLAELEGKRVALNKGSNVHYLLVRALASASVAYNRVETVFLAPSDARAAFEGDAVAAWAVWDPYLAEAELRAGARVLADGEGLVTNREFHLASRRLVREQRQVIRTIVSALDREGRWAESHTTEVVTIMTKELGLEPDVMRRVITRKRYGIAPIDEAVIVEQQRIADTFHTLGLIPETIDVRTAVLPGLLDSTLEKVSVGDGVSGKGS